MERNLSEIIPHLYMGDEIIACDGDFLKQNKIVHILTVKASRLSQCHGKSNFFLLARDNEFYDIITIFPSSYEYIDNAIKANESVLVHCKLGVSRSATIVIAYIMKKFRKPYLQAFNEVKSKRSLINPNPGFCEQLRLWEKMNFEIDPFNSEYRFIVYRSFIELSNCVELFSDQFNQYQAKVSIDDSPPVDGSQLFACSTCCNCIFADYNILFQDYQGCAFMFIEPLTKLTGKSADSCKGLLKCYNCASQIGHYDIHGIRCDEKCPKHSEYRKYCIFRVVRKHVYPEKSDDLGRNSHSIDNELKLIGNKSRGACKKKPSLTS